jgi:hypothetical protein
METVVILTPRTGTKSLKRAVKERHPSSILLYRHMEADGVPHEYDRWQKVGVVRDPVDRLWSLYKYLQTMGLDFCRNHDVAYTSKMRESVAMPFQDWLLQNEVVFASPYDSAGFGRFFAAYSCRHPIPENRKSQYFYLRPDLGTKIFHYEDTAALYEFLDLHAFDGRAVLNKTADTRPPMLSEEGRAYVSRVFSWDLKMTSQFQVARAAAGGRSVD